MAATLPVARIGQVNEAELIAAYQAGDRRAGSELVRRCERITHAAIRSCLTRGMEREDLAQEGRIGLLRGLLRWRPGGAPLMVWVFPFIQFSARKAVQRGPDAVRVPRRKQVGPDAVRLGYVYVDAPLYASEPAGKTYGDTLVDPAPLVDERLESWGSSTTIREQLRRAIRHMTVEDRTELDAGLDPDARATLRLIERNLGIGRPGAHPNGAVGHDQMDRVVGVIEREAVVAALERAHGNMTEAARALGIGWLSLQRCMAAYAVERPSLDTTERDRALREKITAAVEATGGNLAAAARLLGMNQSHFYRCVDRCGTDRNLLGYKRRARVVGVLTKEAVVAALKASGWNKSVAARALGISLTALKHCMAKDGIDVEASARAWREAERQRLEAAVDAAGGNVSKAARALGMKPITLWAKLHRNRQTHGAPSLV